MISHGCPQQIKAGHLGSSKLQAAGTAGARAMLVDQVDQVHGALPPHSEAQN